jgi:predicted small lipoprotein YifL
MRRAGWLVLLAAVLVLAGCGGGGEKGETEHPSEAAKSACNGAALADSEQLRLPPGFPQVENVTYTMQSTRGPTNVIEGYFMGTVEDAHDEYKKELEGAGFKILFDELEDHDSEVSWQGERRTGQVALREECGENDKIYVHITNRPE